MSDKDWKKRFAAETAKHVAMHRKAFAEGGKVPTLHDTMENVAGGIGMGGALEGDSDYHTAVNDPSGRVLGTQSPVDYIAPEALLGAPSAARAAARVAPELLGNEIGSVGSAVKPSAQAKPNFLELEHYSPTGDIKSIDPKHAGTGYDQSVKGRDIGVNVSFHYEKGATPEDLVSGNGYRYSSKIDLNKTPIYDLSSDPEGIAQRSIDRNGRMDMQDITQQVRGAGYGGYKVPGHPDEKLAKSVMLFDPVEPHSVKPIGDIKKIEAGRQAIRTQAERYNQGENLPKPAPHFNEALDPERGAAIANEYEKMEHNPNDPEVQKSYQALNQETRAQFKDIQKRRPDLKIEAIPPGAPNPYNSSDAMTHDLHVNNHLWYFPTDQGFGSEAGAAADHPLMQPTDLKDSNGRPMLANDAFRVVHDYFGHGKELNAFGPKGEEAAWRAHAQMYSPEARRAMTTETRGQNSWVNFGPKGAANRANPGMTSYADQKAGLLPDWASTPDGMPQADPVYSKLEQTITAKMGGAQDSKSLQAMLKDIKPEEMEHSGMNDLLASKPKLTKAEVLEHLNANRLEVKDVTKGGVEPPEPQPFHEWADENIGAGWRDRPNAEIDRIRGEWRDRQSESKYALPKFGQYTLPGGENYREKLYTLPEKSGGLDKNVTMNEAAQQMYGKNHGQLSESEQAAVENAMSVAQRGYSANSYHSSHWDEPNVLAHTRVNDRVDASGHKLMHVEEIQSDWHQAGRKQGYKTDQAALDKEAIDVKNKVNAILDDNTKSTDQRLAEARPLQDRMREIAKQSREGVPNAPFKKTWHEFVLKRLLRDAAEGGYDGMSWTPGAQQAERYDLSKQINEIHYSGSNLSAVDHQGKQVITRTGVSEADLPDLIGKEAAQKLLAQPMRGTLRSLEGQDLKVGGEGMKGFYDKIVPDYLQKLGKKYGAKIGWTEIESPNHALSSRAKAPPTKVPYIEITPELRKAALREGFPMYAAGGMVQRYADGGEVGTVEGAMPSPEPAQAPQEVHVVDSMGDTYPIPPEHLQEALSQGYRQASPEESHDYTTQAQYGTPGQQALSGLEGLASGVLTSTGTAAIERGLGVNPEGIRGRAEANSWTHGLGELGGFAAGAATGFGEAAMLAKAGQAIMPAIKGAGIVSKIGTDALVGGFEGLLMGSDMVGAKAIQQDPDLSAGHAALSIGLTGVMGGILGGAGGALVRRLGLDKEAAKAGAEAASAGDQAYPEPQMFVSTLDAPKLEAGDLATGIKYSEAKPSFKQDFEEAITKGERKPTANLTEAIAEKYNLPVLEGHISANKFVQMGEDALRNSPTVAGQARANKWEGAYKAAEDVLNKAIGDGAGMSKAEVGQMMNDSLRGAIKEENAPIKAMYDQLKLHTEHIPLSLDTGRIITEIEAMPEARLLGNLPGGSIIKGAIDGIAKAQTVDDLKIIGSALNPGFSASPAEKRVAAILRDKLRMLEEDSIEAFAKHTAKTPEEKAAALALRGQREQANAAYKPFMEDLRKLAKALGKRNIGGAADALQFISELTPEQLTSRLFNKNNSQFLKFFEAKFPQQAALMREYQKGVMREQGLIQGVFSPKKFFTAVAKLEPEIQSAIYSKAELRTIAEMQHYLGEFPKNYNPSGTAHMANFRGHFNDMAGPAGIGFGLAGPIGGVVGGALGHFRPGMQDAMIEAYIKKFGATPKGAQAAALAKATLDGEKSAVKAVKAVFDKAKEMPASATVTEGAREKLSEMVDEFSANPDKMIDANAHTPIPAYAQSFSATTARAVQYLAGMRPDTGVKAPLDVKLPPNAFAKADYDNALSIAQQPLHILSRIKSGTMTTQDVQTLKTIYPAVYQSLSEKLMSQVIEASHKGVSVPYQLRLQLSTFLGQPMDSTMTPQAIHSIQAQSAAKEQERKASPVPSASSTKGLKKMGEAAQSPEQSKAAGRAKRNN